MQLLSQATLGPGCHATIIANRSGEYLDYALKNADTTDINIKNICAIIW
jgi:hypothetical protein